MRLLSNASVALAGMVSIIPVSFAKGQGYGTDAQNVLTPAAGGMAGVSIALPQDVPAAVFGNPAALAQFRGTQFTLGGAWVACQRSSPMGVFSPIPAIECDLARTASRCANARRSGCTDFAAF